MSLKLAPGARIDMNPTTPTKTELTQEITLLTRRIKALEHFLEVAEHRVEALHHDRMQARALLHPNAVAVYKAAMRIYLYRHPLSWSSTPVERLVRACARAAKMAKTGLGADR